MSISLRDLTIIVAASDINYLKHVSFPFLLVFSATSDPTLFEHHHVAVNKLTNEYHGQQMGRFSDLFEAIKPHLGIDLAYGAEARKLFLRHKTRSCQLLMICPLRIKCAQCYLIVIREVLGSTSERNA